MKSAFAIIFPDINAFTNFPIYQEPGHELLIKYINLQIKWQKEILNTIAQTIPTDISFFIYTGTNLKYKSWLKSEMQGLDKIKIHYRSLKPNLLNLEFFHIHKELIPNFYNINIWSIESPLITANEILSKFNEPSRIIKTNLNRVCLLQSYGKTQFDMNSLLSAPEIPGFYSLKAILEIIKNLSVDNQSDYLQRLADFQKLFI
jgi:hypothetical protein